MVVLGAGLAGLSAARDLARGGADVVVLEARNRAGGRVEQTQLADGRLVQLGGEVVGPFHEAYCGLVAELGLTLVPSFPQLPGEDTSVLTDGRVVGDDFAWMSDADRVSYDAASEAFGKLASTVDPDDPWSHPDADRLDRISVGQWLREQGATPDAVRARDLAMLSLAAESVERTSLLSDLRKEAAAGANGFYDYEIWECQRVAEGSATVALRMAVELGHRVRYATPVTSVRVARAGCSVTTATGERFDCSAVVSAIPVGPLRRIPIVGVSRERLELAGPPASRAGGEGGVRLRGLVVGGAGPERIDVLREGPDGRHLAAARGHPLGARAAGAPGRLPGHLSGADRAGHDRRDGRGDGRAGRQPPGRFLPPLGSRPVDRGLHHELAPGDVMAVGPLHGTHEPPFYVCGSDQWVAGYMEGAVRTGRGAARALLSDG